MAGKVREIVKVGSGDEVLRRKADDVRLVRGGLSDEDRALVDDMFATMDEVGGVGLAAPQVGVSKRVIVVGAKGARVAFINPKIPTHSQEKHVDREFCLSIPGVEAAVPRWNVVSVVGLSRNGKPIAFPRCTGLLARVIQHELDHLDGVLMTDRANETRRLDG